MSDTKGEGSVTRSNLRWAVAPLRVAELAPREPELRLLRLCDGTRDLQALVAESELPEKKVARLLTRLADRGGVVALPSARLRRELPPALLAWARGEQAPPPSATTSTFSGDDEAFFAAPLPDDLPWNHEEG
jgi:hypothetical protein